MTRLAGRRVVASISGGKDSAAMSLYLHEQGIEHDRVFMDTGWEHPLTYEYLRGELTAKIGPITEIRAKPRPDRGLALIAADRLRPRVRAALAKGSPMVEGILHKGLMPSSARWCTDELKMAPFAEHLAQHYTDVDVVSAVGVRAEESAKRAAMPEWEWSDGLDCEVWRPLISWTEQQVIDIHHRHGLRPNPLYLLGVRRVGCWPCKNARKEEIRLLADLDLERIALVGELEQDVADIQRGKILGRGEEVERHLGGWFRPPLAPDEPWPIDKVVAWSRTSRGGRQYELFGPPANAGCMRWGLCDAASDGENNS